MAVNSIHGRLRTAGSSTCHTRYHQECNTLRPMIVEGSGQYQQHRRADDRGTEDRPEITEVVIGKIALM